MFRNTFFRRLLFNFAFIFVFLSINFLLFYNVYTSDIITISFAIHPFNICEKYPEIWLKIKLFYIPITIISSLICINTFYSSLFNKKIEKKKSYTSVNSNELSLLIKSSNLKSPIVLSEASLYQNILITGTIGSGKTSSAMYPFTRELIKYKYSDVDKKLGMLILDVKGNYYSQVKKYVSHYRREDDLVIIKLRWKY